MNPGRKYAPSDSWQPTTKRPTSSPSTPEMSCSALRSVSNTMVAWSSNVRPLSVSVTPRRSRRNRVVLSSDSRFWTATVSDGWLTRSTRAAALMLPD